MTNPQPPLEVILSRSNIHSFPEFADLLSQGRAVFDNKGRLRYQHGAPIGKLLLRRINKDGTPVYSESAEEWFDPDSPKAEQFQWPE